MKHRTDSVIDSLVSDLNPVRPPMHPRRAWLIYTGLSLAATLVFLLVTGVNPHPRWPMVIGAALAGLGAALVALRSAFPGRSVPRAWVIVLLFALGLTGVFWGARPVDMDTERVVRFGFGCFALALVSAGLPLAFLVLYQRKAAPLRPQFAGILAGAATGFFSLGVMEVHCALLDPAHLMLGHVLPVLFLLVVGALFVRSRRLTS